MKRLINKWLAHRASDYELAHARKSEVREAIERMRAQPKPLQFGLSMPADTSFAIARAEAMARALERIHTQPLAHLGEILDASARQVREQIDVASADLGGVVRSPDGTYETLARLSSLHTQLLNFDEQFSEIQRLRAVVYDTIKQHHETVLRDVEDPKTAALGGLC